MKICPHCAKDSSRKLMLKTMLAFSAFTTASLSAAPVFSSPPTATPNPALVSTGVTFTTAVTDSGGSVVSISWDFGDGTTDDGASVAHSFDTSGIYNVTVTADNGTDQTSVTLNVAVNDPVADGGLPPGRLTVSKTAVKFIFGNNINSKDTLSLQGTIPITANFNPDGKDVVVDINTLEKTFTLDSKGNGSDSGDSFKLSGKVSNGVFSGTTARFTLMLKPQDLLSDLSDLGFTDATVPKPGAQILMPVFITVDGIIYLANVNVTYTAKVDKFGSGK